MSTRSVNINYPALPDPRVVAWLEANNIDPETVPAEQEVLVVENQLAYVEFILEGGKKIRGGYGYLKQIRIVPLLSAPENHGL